MCSAVRRALDFHIANLRKKKRTGNCCILPNRLILRVNDVSACRRGSNNVKKT